MRQNIGRVTRAVVFSVIGFAVCVAFQNCSGYASDYDPLYDNASTTTCLGLACGEDDTMLRLSIANDTVIYTQSGTPTGVCGNDDASCLDIGGYCDDGGFNNNYIAYNIDGVRSPLNTRLTTKCVDGRFTAQIVLPTNFDKTIGHTMTIAIYGIADDGATPIDSTAGGNYRQLNILTYN